MQVYVEVLSENVCACMEQRVVVWLLRPMLCWVTQPLRQGFPRQCNPRHRSDRGSANTAGAQPCAAPHGGRAPQYPPGQHLAVPEAPPPQTQTRQQPPHRGVPLCVPPMAPQPLQAPSIPFGLVPAAPGLFSKGKHEVKR